MKWVREPKIEHHLKKLGLEFTVEMDIPYESIDLKESLERQTRLGKKLNEDIVLQYATSMEAGDAFPMTILNHLKKPEYWYWFSGLHRGHADMLRGSKTFDAYVLNVTDIRMQDTLPRIVNLWETKVAISKEEILINAKYLIEAQSYTTEEVSEMTGLKPNYITAYLRQESIAADIQESGVSPNGLSRTLIIRMAPLADDKNVLHEAARFLKKYNVVGDEAYRFLDDVKRGDTSLKRIAEIAKWEELMKARQPQKKRVFTTMKRDQLLKLVTALHKLIDPMKLWSETQLQDPVEFTRFVNTWEATQRKMKSLLQGAK